MPFTINLIEYRMGYPNTAEFPTLSQSGLLALLLERRRFKSSRLARRRATRQARRQAIRACLGRFWAKLTGNVSARADAAFAGVPRNV